LKYALAQTSLRQTGTLIAFQPLFVILAAATLGPGEVREVERIPEQLKKFL